MKHVSANFDSCWENFYQNFHLLCFLTLPSCQRKNPFVPFSKTGVPYDAPSFQHGFLTNVWKSASHATKRIDYAKALVWLTRVPLLRFLAHANHKWQDNQQWEVYYTQTFPKKFYAVLHWPNTIALTYICFWYKSMAGKGLSLPSSESIHLLLNIHRILMKCILLCLCTIYYFYSVRYLKMAQASRNM
jgi:hypothetical protein